MSRNEIRLRRQRMTASGANRFRNYSDVLHRHERDKRVRTIVRAFIMFLVVLALIILMFVLSQFGEEASPAPEPTHSSAYVPGSPLTP